MTHTPEPWTIVDPTKINSVPCQTVQSIPRGNGNSITAACPGEDQIANARRIVACVNACAGIPTEALENGTFASLIEQIAEKTEVFQYGENEGKVAIPRELYDRLENLAYPE